MPNQQNVLSVTVRRGTANDSQDQTFDVPEQDSQTVLDVVSYIQDYLDPTLSYRFACRVGMCGSCGMLVNGEPRWTAAALAQASARKAPRAGPFKFPLLPIDRYASAGFRRLTDNPAIRLDSSSTQGKRPSLSNVNRNASQQGNKCRTSASA